MAKVEEKGRQAKRPFFTVSNFVVAVVCFAVFLVVGLGGYYLTVGEFVSAELATVYAVLSLIGAAAMLLRLRRFALFYYIGCALGWVCGWLIAGLKGDFAPTAGTICTFFLIAVFALLGLMVQWKGIRKKMARRKEEKEREKAQAEADRQAAELEQAKAERVAAEAVLDAAAVPEEPASDSVATDAPPQPEEPSAPETVPSSEE